MVYLVYINQKQKQKLLFIFGVFVIVLNIFKFPRGFLLFRFFQKKLLISMIFEINF